MMEVFHWFGHCPRKAKNMMDNEAGTTSNAGATASGRPFSRDFEVFLNFRGPDSRDTVVDVINDVLARAGVQVFYDDEKIRQGEVIGEELRDAIINSKIYIPIFSKDYASSKWCLRELELIIKCWEDSQGQEEEKTILPIFFDVHVSTDVKLRSKLYTTPLKKHKKKLGKNVVKQWEIALQKAATIRGWNVHDHGLVNLGALVVKEVCGKLWGQSDSEKTFDTYVGIHSPMEHVMTLLDLEAHDVRFVIIHGMGGVGKTTLARLIYDKICSTFKKKVAFLENVCEKCCKGAGIINLQKDLISQLLEVPLSDIIDANQGAKWIKKRLKKEKVLIVLDNLDKRDQLMKLAGETTWFGTGSRIIITTNDIGIMPENEGFYRYNMQKMKYDDAQELFNRHAFGGGSTLDGCDEILKEAVDAAGGLPKAIVATAPLFKRDNKDEWKGIVERLKEVPPKGVREWLMTSYEHLECNEQELFLDIACLFINEELEDVTYYWKDPERFPQYGIKVLINRSLIEIVDGNKLHMHSLLRELGRNLVDERTPMPERRSRLWSPSVAREIVTQNKGTEEVEALKLGKLDDCNFNHKQFEGFGNLKFLELNGGKFTSDFHKAFSNLRWLSWDNCPHDFQATNLHFEKLKVLKISKDLDDNWTGWNEMRTAIHLKVLKCTCCAFPKKLPDFSSFPELERLVLEICTTLTEIDQSIGMLKHLTHLEIVNIEGQPNGYITYQFEGGGFQILPDSIGNLKLLTVLKLKFMNISELPRTIGGLVNLKYLCLWCPRLKELPDSIGNLKLLVELDISFTAIAKLPDSVINLKSLEVFICNDCDALEEVPDQLKRLIPPV